MCVSIAPDCGDTGSLYTDGISEVSADVSETNPMHVQPETTTAHQNVYTLNDNDNRRRQHFGRGSASRNRTDSLRATASRDLTTARPEWQVTNSFQYAPTVQYPMPTDSDENSIFGSFTDNSEVVTDHPSIVDTTPTAPVEISTNRVS